MAEVDVPVKRSMAEVPSDLLAGMANSRQSHSSLEADNEAPESTNFQSAYYAPPYPRPQADRDHQQESLLQDRERGDLTAHNLELIPDADHVAPGIRLDRGGNDYPFQPGAARGALRQNSNQVENEIADGDAGTEFSNTRGALLAGNQVDKRSSMGGKAPSSVGAATGRSSNGGIGVGAADVDGRTAVVDDSEDLYEDVPEGVDDDMFDEKNVAPVHERVGGSGATSENASKGTSVGHFGPRGEAIPGVPPHLDPRQPHFRPPSPGAASVLSVAVHPPASPKMHGASGLGATPGMTTSISNDISDSGEETESFDNGAMTPTLSEMEDDEHLDKIRGIEPSSPMAASSSVDSTNPFNFSRMNLGSGGPQVSFDPNVLSHESEDFAELTRSARAPSIAATAGSSRAPSARGLSPPVSLSRATTTEGSSLEEYESTGTGIGESGVETPSIIRSRRSSYSAPSSEIEGAMMGGSAGMDGIDGSTRARGATLVAHAANQIGQSSSTTNLHDDNEDDHLRDGPSLAPSEAGSGSTRSMTHESSSAEHGLYSTQSSAGQPLGGLSNNDILAQHLLSSPSNLNSTPATYDVASLNDAISIQQKSSLQPTLPSLLAIKKASRRNGSGAASTAATAGTTSPASSLSVDGDFEDASGTFAEQQVA